MTELEDWVEKREGELTSQETVNEKQIEVITLQADQIRSLRENEEEQGELIRFKNDMIRELGEKVQEFEGREKELQRKEDEEYARLAETDTLARKFEDLH